MIQKLKKSCQPTPGWPLGAVPSPLAELFLIDAELHEADQPPRSSLPNYVHSFCLLADAMDALTTDEQIIYRVKLDMLADRLGDLRTHPYIKERLRDYGTTKIV